MTAAHRIVPNAYKDSVALLAISSKLVSLPGISAASVVMATPTNLENLVDAGLAGGLTASPSDLVVAVAGDDAGACAAALDAAAGLLAEKPADDGAAVAEQPPSSIQLAATRDPSLNLALVSVPGDYAAAEALKAVRLGMSVMIFSDNVPVERELEIKRAADERDLIVMGPDCGTAIVNGIPLGFANVVRRGPIGVVGASGTGTQEVTARIHELGCGVSQAIGTGGHDLAEAIGGISMLRAMRWLEDDPDTTVVVLVSKPPHPTVAAAVLAQAATMTTPVVSIFLGADPDEAAGGILAAASLAQAADLAVALAEGRPAERAGRDLRDEARAQLDAAVRAAAPRQRFVRGIFSGGTFCFEAQLVLRAAGLDSWSNTPVEGNAKLADIATSVQHTIVDMGDDDFTQGRPHPMIDPGLRDERLAAEASDPATAVLLVDVVLGYGSTMDPVSGLVEVLARAARDDGGRIAAIVHVCGTSADPQGRAHVVEQLRACGALVAETNAEAAAWAAYVATELAARELVR
jgi:succinyl-CoA synthetase alpha subunit